MKKADVRRTMRNLKKACIIIAALVAFSWNAICNSDDEYNDNNADNNNDSLAAVVFAIGDVSGGLFSDVEVNVGSYLDERTDSTPGVSPDAEDEKIGIGSISLLPDAELNSGVDSDVDSGADSGVDSGVDEETDTESSIVIDLGSDTDMDTDTDLGSDSSSDLDLDSDSNVFTDNSGSLADLLSGSDSDSESGEGFDLGDWMEGFDPDADFGGLGFVPVTGPGIVSISVIDEDGEYIDGIAITEDGFRTGATTSRDASLVIDQIPYGERVFGVYLTFSFEIESAIMYKYFDDGSGIMVREQIGVVDAADLPPVVITDETVKWDIIFVLHQIMEINVSYYAVSPNDRFYFIRSIIQNDTNENESEENHEITHRINTFQDAPVRVAIYIEMPAIKGVRRIRIEGEGFGNAGIAAGGADGFDNAGIGAMGTGDLDADAGHVYEDGEFQDKPQWYIENEYADYLMPDWTFVDHSFQLISGDSEIGPENNSSFIRYIILSLPSAFEGAKLKFDSISLMLEDGSEIVFADPYEAELIVQIVEAPKLL